MSDIKQWIINCSCGLGWIFFVLLFLKIYNVISIAWIWIFSPFWLPAVSFGICYGLLHLIAWIDSKI